MTDLLTPSLTQDTAPFPESEVRVKQTDYDLDVLQHELDRANGHQYAVESAVPVVLRRFFTGDVDLDTELGKRFVGSPLLSECVLRPERPGLATHGTATLTTQDESATLIVDVSRQDGRLELSFTLGAMLSLRFILDDLSDIARRRWLDLMRREQGVAFLWGPARWERDYMIFVVRKYQIRAYAFSAHRFEAAVHLTPDVLKALLDWLESYWF